MKSYKIVAITAMIAMFCIGPFKSPAQSAAEMGILTSANPRYPKNAYYKALSSTTYPVAIAIPFGVLAFSMINNDDKGEQAAYEYAGSILISALATEGLKAIIKRPRPYVNHGDVYPDEIDDASSFPSAHTSIAFATATSVLLVSKKWYYVVPAFTWASAVGYSRLYLGQHYPSDIFAGAVVGAASAYASHWLNKKIFAKKKR